KYAARNYPVPVRLSALGYYYESGTTADLPQVTPLKSDSAKVPPCAKDAEQCAWTCTVQGAKGPEAKEIQTVGDFVTYCLVPGMEKREPETPVASSDNEKR